MSEPLTIKSGPPEDPAMDFSLLREKGLEYIRRFAPDTWTDHNTHDPGITILEALCYAITDLGYRLSYDIEDLLASPSGGKKAGGKPFFTAREILPSGPVSTIDYRRVLIDIEGVKNAWIEPLLSTQPELFYADGVLSTKSAEVARQVQLRGLSRIYIERDRIEISDSDLLKRVGMFVGGQRNLCEDLASIVILPETSIIVRAGVEIEHGVDPDSLLARMYHDLSLHISPNITFHSLNEMKELGKRNEEIFNGPVLKHGFIDDEQLRQHQRKTEFHISDMIHVVMQIEGISGIREMKIAQSDQPKNLQEWVLKLEKDVAPTLTSVEEFCDQVDLYKDGIICSNNPEAVREKWYLLRGDTEISDQESGACDITPPGGVYRNLADYESIQNHFPNAYGIGEMGLPESASAERQAQAYQLQAYLTIFDQILANYFSQLDHARQLLAIPGASENDTVAQSYFPHPLSGIPGEKEFLDRDDLAKTFAETRNGSQKRRDRLFDHLLARFGERFPDISHLAYDTSDTNDNAAPLGRLIRDKANFLADYSTVSLNRARAFNYGDLEGTWDTENVSGLKRRVCGLLGVEGFQRKKLAVSDEEGFHMVEHILLRPRMSTSVEDPGQNNTHWHLTCKQPDPYSYAVTYLFPKWPSRFSQTLFQEYVQELLAVETPAHISFAILWLEKNQMQEFEEKHGRWLSAMEKMALPLTATEVQFQEIAKANEAMSRFLGIDQSTGT